MLNPSLETKCFIFSIATFLHSNPSLEHLLTASCFLVVKLNSLIVLDPQEGQDLGNSNFVDLVFLFFVSTEII